MCSKVEKFDLKRYAKTCFLLNFSSELSATSQGNIQLHLPSNQKLAGTIFGHAHGPCSQIFSPFISLDSSTLELLTCDEDVNSHFSARDVKVLGF